MRSVVDIPSYGRRGCTTSSGLYMWITVLGSDCRCEGPGGGKMLAETILLSITEISAPIYTIFKVFGLLLRKCLMEGHCETAAGAAGIKR